MYEEVRTVSLEKDDTFKSILSKYGCLALDKQKNLADLIGDTVGDLNLEEGTISFDDYSFDIQIMGFFDEASNHWSWAWDNENIGFNEEFIKSAVELKAIGEEYEINLFTSPVLETTFEDVHTLAMVGSSLLGMDAYYAANVDGLDIFVFIKSDLIKEDNSAERFRLTFNDFQKHFSIIPKIAIESYSVLKGYRFKERENFTVTYIDESRIITGFTERGNITHIQLLSPDKGLDEE